MVDLKIDISEMKDTVTAMKGVLNNKAMGRVIHDTLSDTAKKTKTLVKRTVAKEYNVTQKWAADQIGHHYMKGLYSAQIPLSGHRGSIGGTFPATTGPSKSGGGARRKVLRAAKIRRGKSSPLTHASSNQGSGQIFLMPGAAKKIAVARKGMKLVRIVGRSVPQMVTESPSTEVIEKDITDYMMKRVDHHIKRALNDFK